MWRIIFISIIILLENSCFAQGVFIDDGKSSIFLGAGISKSEDIRGVGYVTGYSWKGLLDMSFSFNDIDFLHSDQAIYKGLRVYSLAVSVYPLKQISDLSISMSIDADLCWQRYLKDNYDLLSADIKGNFTSIGLSIYGFLWTQNNWKLILKFGITQSSGTIKSVNTSANLKSIEKSSALLFVGISTAFFQENGEIANVTPVISYTDGKASLSLGIGVNLFSD